MLEELAMAVHHKPVHLPRLLDRQGNLAELRRRATQEGSGKAPLEFAHLKEGPWLTISKQLGSGASDLAHRLADRLGWLVYDREILEAISTQAHYRDAILARLDEREVGWIEDSLARLLVPDDPGKAAFQRELLRVVLALGRQGRAILLGRGANWVLDPRFGLRVRVVQPGDDRARALAHAEGMELALARERVRQDDSIRAAYIRQAFRRDIDDPLGYDMMVNLGALDLEAAADAVEAGLRRKLG
jgi:cytidylate kinase